MPITELETRRPPESGEGVPILYLQDPIPTPEAVFSLYLHQKVGKLGTGYQVVSTLSAGQDFVEDQFLTVSSSKAGFVPYLRGQFQEAKDQFLSGRERKVTERLVNYFGHCHRKKGVGRSSNPLENLRRLDASTALYDLMVESTLRHWDNSREAIEAGFKTIDYFVSNNLDPFSYGRGEPSADRNLRQTQLAKHLLNMFKEQIDLYHSIAEYGPRVSFEVPIIYREEKGSTARRCETRIEDKIELERPLGRLRILEGQRVSVVIVGPPDSGKTTLTACLVYEINRILKNATSYPEFADLQLKCGFVDLDKISTGNVERILDQQQQAQLEKVSWNIELAKEVAREFLSVGGLNIIIADAPGGGSDDIRGGPRDVSGIVITPADLGVFLIRSENDDAWIQSREQWKDTLRKSGVKAVAQIRSRKEGEIDPLTNEELTSMITTVKWADIGQTGKHDWISSVGGRILSLNRRLKPGDAFISLFARILVFDIFPQAVFERYNRTINYLELLFNEYSRRLERK